MKKLTRMVVDMWRKRARREARTTDADGDPIGPRRGIIASTTHDVRYALRALTLRPLFTLAAVLIVGLGIGASTTLFSVVNKVLLRPLPYEGAADLVYIGTVFRDPLRPRGFTAPEFLEVHRHSRTLGSYAAYQYTTLNAHLAERPTQLQVTEVTLDFFQVFRLNPLRGRGFVGSDFLSGAEPVVILSHQAWQRYWGGDPTIIGSTLTASEQRSGVLGSHTIIGVLPPGFRFTDADLWMPLQVEGTEAEERWESWGLNTIGRLGPGRSIEDVRIELAHLGTSLATQHPQYYSGRYFRGRSIGVAPLRAQLVADYRRNLLLLFGATALLLVIATANVTGLFLARVLGRSQEIVLRSALGASRSRIFQLIVTETMLVTLLGCVVGLAIADTGSQVFRLVAPLDFPRLETVSLDSRAVFFAGTIALLCGMLCGIASAALVARTAGGPFPRGALAPGGRRASTRLRGVLMSIQVALATSLLIGAGLLANSYARLRQVDPGIRVEGLLLIPIRLPGSYDSIRKRTDFYSEVTRRLRSVPGVESASWATTPSMYGRNWVPEVMIEGMTDDADLPGIPTHPTGPDYFQTMGIPVLSGRGITGEDDHNAPPIVVIDEAVAERFWSGENPLGKRLRLTGHQDGPWHTVAGVVGSVHGSTLAEDPYGAIYVPSLQRTLRFSEVQMVLRSALPPGELLPQLRAAIWEVDPDLPVPAIRTMKERISEDLRGPRLHTLILGSFAVSAVILTLAGIYALMLYLVTERTREIGVRMALGAGAGRVLWTVTRQCLSFIGIGTLAGLGAAALSSRLLTALVFGITPLDLTTYGIVAVLLDATAVLACLLPAMRATRVDPTTALSWE